ncbi:hypothetical protein WA158_001218 [Blastocystis sp. Blastoise]
MESIFTYILLICCFCFIGAVLLFDFSDLHHRATRTQDAYLKLNTLQEIQFLDVEDHPKTQTVVVKREFPLNNSIQFDHINVPHPSSKTYIDNYRKIVDDMYNGRRPLRRVIYKPANSGFGNRFLCMTHAMFLAMVTDRAFEVCDWPAMAEYIQFTIPVRSTNCKETLTADYTTYHDSTPLEHPTPSTLYATFHTTDVYYDTCLRIMDFFMHVPFMQPTLKAMGIFEQPYSHTKIEAIRHMMLSQIVKPVDPLQRMINDAALTLPRGNYLGLQLRTGNKASFIKGRSKPLLDGEAIEQMLKKMELLSRNYGQPIKWFVVSDSNELKKILKEKYPNYIVTYNAAIDHIGTSSLKEVSQASYDAIIEAYLLARCHVVVCTAGSTFGTWARMVGGIED